MSRDTPSGLGLDDSDDDYMYEEVEVDGGDEEIDDGEDLETALIKVRQQQRFGTKKKTQHTCMHIPDTID